MPNHEIDYSNTIIYKITCKDTQVTDVYVGHTTNFVQRKHAHIQNSKNEIYNCKLYKVIRDNGGWSNWTMEILNFYNCKNLYEARIKEQEYFVLLKANLNSFEPLPKPKEIITNNTHINISATQKCTPKKIVYYECLKCNIKTGNKKDYEKHLLTAKHIKHNESISNNRLQCSICNKEYKSRNGIWKHAKTCNVVSPTEQFKNLINDLVKDNTDAQKQHIEAQKQHIELQKQHNELQKQNIELQKTILDICKHLPSANHDSMTNI